MWNQLKQKLLREKKVAGIEINIQSDKKLQFYLTILSQDKKQIHLSETKSCNTFDELPENLKDIPVALVLTGKGILQRHIEEQELTDREIIHQVLPNANPADFYLQQQSTLDAKQIVSVIRKSLITDILHQLEGLKILNISLGPFVSVHLLPLLNSAKLEVRNYSIEWKDGQIKDFHLKENIDPRQYSVGEEIIGSDHILSFSAAFQYFIAPDDNLLVSVPEVEFIREEWEHKKLFKVLGSSLLAFFLIILLINFFFYSYLRNKHADLESALSQNRDQIILLQKLKEEAKEKEMLLQKIGWEAHSATSFYADQIASTVPKTIKLTQLVIYPEVESKRLGGTEELLFQNNEIFIAGTVTKSTDLNEWIKKLEKLHWAKNVSVVNYSQEKREKIFNLKIKI